MLESLQIKNFAIIDSVQLDFDVGLSALTGETGAGKSIIIDAIKLIAGDRADNESIRAGTEHAELSACFRIDFNAGAGQWLEDNAMSADGECLIRRVLLANGRSKAFINGYNATLGQLRDLCALLVDIHGQHQHQSLQKPQVQSQLLDAFLAEPELLRTVRHKAEHCHQLEQRMQQARSGSQARVQRIDLLELYCNELNQLNFADGEIDELQATHKKLANAGILFETTGQILDRLYEGDTHSAQSLLSVCEAELGTLLQTDAALGPCHELIDAALIQIREASTELRAYRDGLEMDGASLEAVNERIATAQALARKHRVEITELPALAQQLNSELVLLNNDGFDVDALQQELETARDEYRFSAGELSRKRRQTARALSDQITAVMQELGMSGGCFVIEVESLERITMNGSDSVRYLVSANPGQPPKTLSKVASGGELSRIGLAIQVIMSESTRISTLIFDEVDSGVGGGVAEIVGKKLRLLGKGRQVFCVTHLPQVASQAHHHFLVEKGSRRDHTQTDVVALHGSTRLEEVARMLGGVKITAQTRAHASEMIASQET